MDMSTHEPTLDELVEQQHDLILDEFDYEVAWCIGASIRTVAAQRSLPIAIEVTHGDTPIFLALMPGATPDNVDWVRRKRAVALRFHQSSLYMRIQAQQMGWDFSRRFRIPEADFAASGGGIPLTVRNAGVVGAVSVSGLKDVLDHSLGAEALKHAKTKRCS